jgi:hypothetical protein
MTPESPRGKDTDRNSEAFDFTHDFLLPRLPYALPLLSFFVVSILWKPLGGKLQS